MAIYHLKVKTFQRGKTASAVAAAAYRAGDDLVQEQERIRYDYSRRSGVEYTALYCPAGTRYLNRQEVWNAAERSEKRKDARVAREVLVAIPHELNKQERRELVQAFATVLMARYQTVIDLAIHEPHQQGDERNYHAHLLMATRRINERGEFGEKIRQLDLPTESAHEIT
ncbi:MAG: MobA/MobL family protein, partial [Gloeomargarita sp. SKYG98]|nr:MobA/MobL family protein [Gloeomargarita sp. SKYG98]